MSKKFTEEQYQQIIEAFENKGSYHKGFSSVMDVVNSFTGDYSYKEAFILGLTTSREWAYEQFVEKEKKYYWKLNGLYLRKDYSDNSIIFDSRMYKHSLTESEVKEWGYNPEMFDKEEVE